MAYDDKRHKQTVIVMEWITEKYGPEVASWWYWECTPMPCGLPDDEQLRDGLRLAAGEMSIAQLGEKVDGKVDYHYRMIDKVDRMNAGAGDGV